MSDSPELPPEEVEKYAKLKNPKGSLKDKLGKAALKMGILVLD